MNADDFLDFDRDTYLAETDRLLGLPKGWSAAQIRVESNNDPAAVSRAGAMGLAQVMPKTLRTLSERAGRKLDPFNEADALYIHREAMKENLAKFQNPDDAARAYNNGWNRDSWNNPETASYASKIHSEIAEPGSSRGKVSRTAAKRGMSADAFLDIPDESPVVDAPSADAFLDAPEESVGAMDYLKQFGGSVVKSAGDALTGIGKAGDIGQEEIDKAWKEDPGLAYVKHGTGVPGKVLAAVANPVGGWLTKKGEAILGTRSQAAKTAMENTTPEGNIIQAVREGDASGLTLGKSPTAAGFGLQAANISGQVLPQVGIAVSTRGQSIPAQIATGTLVGASQGVGSAVSEVRDWFGSKTDEQLAAISPVFRERIAKGEAPADARAALAKETEDRVAKYVAPVSAAGGALTGALLGKAGGHALESAAKGSVARAVIGAVLGAAEEGIQEVGEGVAQRKGVNDSTGDTRDLGDGSFGEFALGAAGGAGMGGVRGAITRHGKPGAAIDAGTVVDAEAPGSAPLALPAPVVRVDSRGNARMDGVEPPFEAAARVSGRADTSEVRQTVRDELKALGYEPTPRSTPTPIIVDSEGAARTDGDTQVRDTSFEPAAKAVGRADIVRDELGKLGFEPSAPRGQQTPISVDGRGNAVTDEQSARPQERDATLGDLPRKSGRAEITSPSARAPGELGFDQTRRATPTPISVDAEGQARVQGETRSSDQIATERLESEASKLFPKKGDEARRAEWIDAQRQRELGFEDRMRELAERANTKRARRKVEIEQTSMAAARALSPTSELGVVTRVEADGSISYFFYANPDEKLVVKPGAAGEPRSVVSATPEDATQSALLRAALADGPLAVAPRLLSPKAMRQAGAASDRLGATRLVGRAADKARISGELNRMAAKTAESLLAKAPIAGDDIGMARAAIAAEPRRAVAVLRGKDADAMIEALRQIAGEQGQITSTRQESTTAADEDFVSHVTEAGRDAVKAGHMTRDEFFAATRAAREGNREAAVEALRRSDARRGVQSQPAFGRPAENIDPEARVDLDPTFDHEHQFGEPDFMGDPTGTMFGALSNEQSQAVSAALRDILALGVPRAWVNSVQGFFVNTPKFPGGLANFFKKNLRGKTVRGVSFKQTDVDSTVPGLNANLAEQQEFRGQLIHELAHNGDFDGNAMRSASDSRLAITTDGSIEAKGAVAQEVFDLYGAQDGSSLATLFAYPLEAAFDATDSGKPLPAALVQSEIHAQIVRAYFTNRAELERRAPKAYEYARSVIEAKPGDRADARVPAEVRQERVDPARGDAAQSVDRADGRGHQDRQDSRPAGEPVDSGRLRDERDGREQSPGRAGVNGSDHSSAGPREGRATEENSSQARGLRDDGAARRSARSVAVQPGAEHRSAGEVRGRLAGLPATIEVPGRGAVEVRPTEKARAVAEAYARDAGIDYKPPTTFARVDEGRARRIADAYAEMAHDPSDPEVKAAYDKMIEETLAQWAAIKKYHPELKVEFIDFEKGGDPYAASPRLAIIDVQENNHLWVFPTTDGFGSSSFDASSNPLLRKVGETLDGVDMVANDVFRIVHDYFGHVKEAVGFRADGEENAWRLHSAMYSPLARRAMTSETRGQNSWVNYGPHGDSNRTASGVNTVFADQKTGLLPEWVSQDGAGIESPNASADPIARRSSRMGEEMDALSRRSSRESTSAASNGQAASADASRVSRLAAALSKDAGTDVRVRHVEVEPKSSRGQLAAAMKQYFGVETVYFQSDDPNAPAGGAYVPGDPKTVYIHARGDVDPVSTFGHEFTHSLKEAHPDLHAGLMAALRRVSRDSLANREFQEQSYGRKVSDSLVEEENLSDVAGAAFKQDRFWEEFQAEMDSTGLKRFFRWAARWLNRLVDVGFKVDLSKDSGFGNAAISMRTDLARAYAEAARRSPTVRSVAADAELGLRRSSRASEHAQEDQGRTAGAAAAAVGALGIKATAPVMAGLQVTNKVVDSIGEQLARVSGVKALGAKAVSLAERALDAKSSWSWLEKAKQGLISDYGLPAEYLSAKFDKTVRENKLMREAKGTLDRLSSMTPDQLSVAYQWLQEKPDTARERELLERLPAVQQEVMRQMKTDIDNLSKEAVKLGLITPETYERNKMAYVHRSYKKYEAELTGSQAVARQRAQRLKGDQFKGRGMELEASLDRVRGDLPEDLKGLKLEMLEKRDNSGKLIRREYLVQGAKRPVALEGYANAGTWEVRDATKAGNIKVWRDFTLAERQRMGEIEDARYAFARTMVQGVRDVETSRLLQWTAINYGKDSDAGLDVVDISGAHAVLGSQTFTRDQWVKVPETKIKGTQVARYGDLAGKYLPAVMYSDIAGAMELRNGLWDKLLGAWKISKTALSPAVHVNNVMSNFIMADLAEVGVNDLRKALETIVASKAGDARAKALIERYDDSGAEGGSFASNEIRTSVIEPLLQQIAKSDPESVQKASLANVVALAAHGSFREAGIASTKTLPGRALGSTMGAMIKAYQSEDSVFRLAKFLNEIEAGKSDADAGKAARDAFLNYDINAPWVRAARRSVLPFVSFTYRAVPLLAKAVVTKPWKFAKYAALGEALSMLTYMALGAGGDREKEERLLPEDLQGKSLGLPKMVRLPWNNESNDPMWLDVRRWLPAGDITDTSGSKASVPLPSWLSIGGPLSLLIDFYSNTNWRGDKIVKPTDTAGEMVMKVSDTLAKFMLPNLPTPGLGWLMRKMGAPVDSGMLDPYGWTGIEKALDGAKTGLGKETDAGLAVSKALGVKVDSRRLADEAASVGLDAKAREKVIETEARSIGRKMARGEISREEGERRIAREIEKLKELGKKTREKLSPASSD
ncbi:transglycosylase SLT domain-containing protein [Variovorax sp. 278MFTsu5.1]|uniref:transglycosylase SLT domain-containing protein n=1 Tax=Variovorax sp. 278MFTsu5.1 TaxID=3158366 RepID=UPI003AAE0B34